MIRSVLLLLPIVALTACPKQESTTAAAATAEAPKGESIDGAKIPDDAASRTFATKLVRNDAKDFKPTDAAGAVFVYKSVDFRADNTWSADSQMTADGETIDCKESGTWEMDPAADESTANMTWKLQKTNCAGRPDTADMRLKVTIGKDGAYAIVFR